MMSMLCSLDMLIRPIDDKITTLIGFIAHPIEILWHCSMPKYMKGINVCVTENINKFLLEFNREIVSGIYINDVVATLYWTVVDSQKQFLDFTRQCKYDTIDRLKALYFIDPQEFVFLLVNILLVTQPTSDLII